MYENRHSALKSPCYDCDLLDYDKNNDRCLKCDARAEYALLVDEGLIPTVLAIERKKKGSRIQGFEDSRVRGFKRKKEQGGGGYGI